MITGYPIIFSHGILWKVYIENVVIPRQAMITLDTLNDAIEEKRKVSFIYNRYGTDCKLHPRRDEPYIVNPYI